MRLLKRAIKQLARSIGLEVSRYDPTASRAVQLETLLRLHHINLVFDIGANVGQYARFLRQAGYKGKVVSFEPLATAHTVLCIANKFDADWEIAPRAAIGAEDGEIEINVAANSVSSSVLEMLDTHLAAAPKSRYVDKEWVPLRRLDSIAMKYLDKEAKLFLKIDAQGYEERVLEGAKNILPYAIGLQLELSLVPLYSGQAGFLEILHLLQEQGFDLYALFPEFIDPNTGRLLQVDGLFFRTKRIT